MVRDCATCPLGRAPVYLQWRCSPRGSQEHKISRLRRQSLLQQLRKPLLSLLQQMPPDIEVPNRALGKTCDEGGSRVWGSFYSFYSYCSKMTVSVMKAVSTCMNDLSSSDRQQHGSFNNTMTYMGASHLVYPAEGAVWSRIVCAWINHGMNLRGWALFCTW